MKKILAIDDQELILMSLEYRFIELGYDIKTANNGECGTGIFDDFKPDLVIVDMNMPGMSGTDVVKHIRQKRKSQVPIMVLSGNTDEDVILKSYDIGVEDYMQKPVSLEEIQERVERLLDDKLDNNISRQKTEKTRISQKTSIGVVIPCYNEEKRILSQEFINFVYNNSGYHLCFVNDGSTDNTLQILKGLKKYREHTISIYNCEKKGGKAEAVRQGAIYLSKNKQLDYIGFLDANLSTDFADFAALVKEIESKKFKIVSSSKISWIGTNITKKYIRHLAAKSVNLITQKMFGMPFKDTPFGAKIMDKEIIDIVFKNKFINRQLFDVEIFMRMKRHYGSDKVKSLICEQPL